LAARQAPLSGGAITTMTRVSALADAWLETPHDWSITTARLYRTIVENNVKPALGELRVQEVTSGVITRALRAIAERSGPSAAKTSRSCLSGMFALAVEDRSCHSRPASRIDYDSRRCVRVLCPGG
jgi:hypothetical protein